MSRPKGECPHCHRNHWLRADGALGKHPLSPYAYGQVLTDCPGSGKPPTVKEKVVEQRG